MGADGGITWVKVKDSKYQKRAQDLISILGLYESHRDEHSEWIRENGLPYPSNVILTADYGTDLNHYGMMTVRDILEEEYDCDLTFSELLEDLATRPEWQMFNLFRIELAILRVCWLDYEYGYYTKHPCNDRLEKIFKQSHYFDSVKDMKVSDWVDELKKILVMGSFDQVETWT